MPAIAATPLAVYTGAMEREVTTTYLEILDPGDHTPKRYADPEFRILECTVKQFSYNRFLYHLVGQGWHWTDKRGWTDGDWQRYAEDENLRTWVAYVAGSPAGYYELQRQACDDVEIIYFGLASPFIGKGFGGPLLSHAIQSAWDWGARRVWTHTCSLDHPHALANYQARGMRICRRVTAAKTLRE
jgi:GNAT superfamily N-acetyltransferase